MKNFICLMLVVFALSVAFCGKAFANTKSADSHNTTTCVVPSTTSVQSFSDGWTSTLFDRCHTFPTGPISSSIIISVSRISGNKQYLIVIEQLDANNSTITANDEYFYAGVSNVYPYSPANGVVAIRVTVYSSDITVGITTN